MEYMTYGITQDVFLVKSEIYKKILDLADTVKWISEPCMNRFEIMRNQKLGPVWAM